MPKTAPTNRPLFSQLRERVILPTLARLAVAIAELDSPTARNLTLGTAAQESGGAYLAQYPAGPALSFWQIEPATERDILTNFAPRFPAIGAALDALRAPGLGDAEQLTGNLFYACAICRLVYYRVPEALPDGQDVSALGQYWKTYYNTAGGAGAVDEFVRNFATHIGAPPDA